MLLILLLNPQDTEPSPVSGLSTQENRPLVFLSMKKGDKRTVPLSPDSCVRLPMIDNDSARSLNLSNAVAVGAYEVLRQWGYPEMRTAGRLTKFDW